MNFEAFKAKYQKVPVEEYPNRVCQAMPAPVVSVKVSTYQHAGFIQECLDSILMQETSFPFEIVIGEDESTDGTREVCIRYADRHPDKIRLFLHARENNISLKGRPSPKFQSVYSHFMCRGTYIAWCEGDDYWRDPGKLQKQVDFLEGHEEYVVSFHGAITVDTSGQVLREATLPEDKRRDHSQVELAANAFVNSQTICFRQVFSEFPPEYFDAVNGDIFLLSLLGQHGKGKFQHEIEPAAYRIHEGGMWSPLNYCAKLESNIDTKKRMHRYHERVGNEYIAREVRSAYQDLMRSLVHSAMTARDVSRTVKYFLALNGEYLRDGNYEASRRLTTFVMHRLVGRCKRVVTTTPRPHLEEHQRSPAAEENSVMG